MVYMLYNIKKYLVGRVKKCNFATSYSKNNLFTLKTNTYLEKAES